MSQLPVTQIRNTGYYYPTYPHPVDTMSYNNNVLTRNITYLSSLQVHELFAIKAENEKIKQENNELKTKNADLEKEISDIKKRTVSCEDKKDVKKTKPSNRFKPFWTSKTDLSWSDEKVKEVIGSINTIGDIINLDRQWEHLKHNQTLQRLYYLIPALVKLQNMIGLDQIKKDIFKKIIYFIQNPHNDEYLHTIISGPPGVGKTEFAKIYANIFVRLGVLQSDRFIEIKRDDLVGEFLGQTAPRTRKLLEDAMDGVLFLDEAYSLGNEEKRDSFSKEAIDMINQYLSERKGKFMFIVAGYEDDLNKCLFAYNKGMRRRFHSHYNISGYKPDELRQIFLRKLRACYYNTKLSDIELNRFFKDNKDQFTYYGGDIEKLVNEIKQVQSLRTFNTNAWSKDVLMSDITEALSNIEEKKETSGPPPMMYV